MGMTIDEMTKKIKDIFSYYELDLPYTDSLEIESEILIMLEELNEYQSTLLTPQMIEDLKKSEKQAHKEAIQNAMLAEDSYNKAVDDFAERLTTYLGVEDSTKYGNKNTEQMRNSYGTLMNYEIAEAIEDVAKQLKERKNDGE